MAGRCGVRVASGLTARTPPQNRLKTVDFAKPALWVQRGRAALARAGWPGIPRGPATSRRRLAFVRWSMHEGYAQFMEEVCS